MGILSSKAKSTERPFKERAADFRRAISTAMHDHGITPKDALKILDAIAAEQKIAHAMSAPMQKWEGIPAYVPHPGLQPPTPVKPKLAGLTALIAGRR
jgi:hypothetical protein